MGRGRGTDRALPSEIARTPEATLATWVESQPLSRNRKGQGLTANHAALPPGTALGTYEIVRPLGSGGMATVYEARHRVLQKRVALKVLKRGLSLDPEAVSRLVTEGQAVASLYSPHIVEVYDVQAGGDLPFLVLEYLEGHDLKTELQLRGRLPLDELVELMLPLLSAIDLAHSHGIIHRDLKPSNLFLSGTREGQRRPVVLDFGISKCLQLDPERTPTDMFFGTAAYTAPELVRSARQAGPLSDQYSLGVVLYECATGHNPFKGADLLSTLHATATVTPPLASSLAPLPPALDALLSRAMSKEPRFRYPGLQQMAEALQALQTPTGRAPTGHETTCTAPSIPRQTQADVLISAKPRARTRREGLGQKARGVLGDRPQLMALLLLSAIALPALGYLEQPLRSTVASSPEKRTPSDHRHSERTVAPPSSAALPSAVTPADTLTINSIHSDDEGLPRDSGRARGPAPAPQDATAQPAEKPRRPKPLSARRRPSKRRARAHDEATAREPTPSPRPVTVHGEEPSPARRTPEKEKSPCEKLNDAADRRYCQSLGLGD